MNENKVLQSRAYTRIVRDFAEQNFNLKALCGLLFALVFLLCLMTLYLIRKGPTVIALDGAGNVGRIETRTTENQIQAAVGQYMAYRYSWSPETISSGLDKAEAFVASSLVPAFRKSMSDVQRFVAEKKVTQRVYVRDAKPDVKTKEIVIIADRITEFDKLKAATEMQLTLGFTSGPRTNANPWGIYFTKESERGER